MGRDDRSMNWSPENITGQLAEISNAREAMHRKWGDQSALPLERHLAFVIEGLGNVSYSINAVSHHRDRTGGLRNDNESITGLKTAKEAAWQTAANLLQLVEAIKRREASL